MDFAVDPLFKKTSADFDEGGARGLLLNHLGIDQYCKIIFDASDATIECDTEELDGDVSGHVEEEEEEKAADKPENSDEKDNEKVTEDDLKDDPMQEESSSDNADETVTELEKNPDAMEIDSVEKEKSPIPDEELPPVEAEKEVLEASEKSLNKESLIEISRLKGNIIRAE